VADISGCCKSTALDTRLDYCAEKQKVSPEKAWLMVKELERIIEHAKAAPEFKWWILQEPAAIERQMIRIISGAKEEE